MAVRSTWIEFWPSDQLLVIGKFEFLRQNISLPCVNNLWSLDQKTKNKKIVKQTSRYISDICRYIGQFVFFFLIFSQAFIFVLDLCRIYQ